MGLKAMIPGTAAYSRRHYHKYIHKKLGGHDVLLFVEWADGKLTELAADVHPEKDGWLQAENGLYFAPAGEGTEPVDYYGVPVIRVHASIACPISTTAAIQAEHEEQGDYDVVEDDRGRTDHVVRVEMEERPDAATNGHDTNGEAVADGGVATDTEVTHRYNLRPPSPAVGWSFGLDEVKQRAPNGVSANMLRRAVEYGKESERGEGGAVRYLLIGIGVMLGIIVVLGVLWAVLSSLLGGGGGGGGGGGSATNLGLLALAAAPLGRSALARARDWTQGE